MNYFILIYQDKENKMSIPGFPEIDLSNIDHSADNNPAEDEFTNKSHLENDESSGKELEEKKEDPPKETNMEDILLLDLNEEQIKNDKSDLKFDIIVENHSELKIQMENQEIDLLKFEEESSKEQIGTAIRI